MKDWLAELGSKWMKECDGQLSLALAMRDQAQHLLQLLVLGLVQIGRAHV